MQIIIFVIFVIYIITYTTKKGRALNNKYTQSFFLLSFIFVSTSIVITSGIDFVDKARYTNHFIVATKSGFLEYIYRYSDNLLFYTLTYLIARITDNPNFYYFIIHMLFIYFLLYGLYLIFNRNLYLTVLAFFIFINYIFYYNHTLNILRQGIAFSLIIFSIGLILNNNRTYFISLFLAPFFHWASLFFSVFVFLTRKLKSPNTMVLTSIYAFFSILYLTNTSAILTGPIEFMIPSNAESYLNLNRIDYYGGSYKIQFWIYNTVFFILLVCPLVFKRLFESTQLNNYQLLFFYYTIFSSVFMLFGFIPYTDRVAAYSWMVIPIMIAVFIEAIKFPKLLKVLILVIIAILGILTTPLDGRFFYK